MRRSKTEIYLHLVWTTKAREPHLVGELERAVHRSITHELQCMGCATLAIGGTADHVHVALRMPSKHSPAAIVKQAKGCSSHLANEMLPDGIGFRWQEGYGAFSVSRNHVPKVVRYVQEQKARHELGRTWPEWEETLEDADAGSPTRSSE